MNAELMRVLRAAQDEKVALATHIATVGFDRKFNPGVLPRRKAGRDVEWVVRFPEDDGNVVVVLGTFQKN